MSTGLSAEQQVPPQMEQSNLYEGGDHEDAKIKKVNIEECKKEVIEECRTPTWSGNKIPIIQNCPPTPRKKRRPLATFSPRVMKRSSTTGFNYVVKPEEVESFFQSMIELTRVNKEKYLKVPSE
ncbi:hypothetical protein RJT34_29793 [Clitoria ternatea]|uniref:Uncharacterized protein n=1 Tax=Clitoria ternatea TaxID=43366 RepID=A0AAN9EVW8_CLITE